MPVQLAEYQAGFDAEVVGFPSVRGCLALAAVCETGVFGYHTPPTSVENNRLRARYFAQFISEHFFRSPITRLYGVTHAWDRGVIGDHVRGNRAWRDELRIFAEAMGYRGALYGCNLDALTVANAQGGRSAYVEVRKAGEEGQVFFKNWNDADGRKGPNREGYRMRKVRHDTGVSPQTGEIYIAVDRGNLRPADSIRLRG